MKDIINRVWPNRPWPEGGKTDQMIIKCMQAYEDEYTEYLLQLQSELKDTLFVRPYDIEAIESAAIKLCDAIIELKV